MIDRIIQKVSLVGQVVEDLSYRELQPGHYFVKLAGTKKEPQYKDGGFFVFSDLPDDPFHLKLSGRRFQTQDLTIQASQLEPLPQHPLASPVIFHKPGDNELIVKVTSTETVNGDLIINFGEEILSKALPENAPVLANNGFTATLMERIEEGSVLNQVRVDEPLGTTPVAEDIVRIIRSKSIRLRFDPYHKFSSPTTRIVGKVALSGAPEIPLEGVKIMIVKVNTVDLAATPENVAGAKIETVTIAGSKIILGTSDDISSLTNSKGDYNLYFNRADFLNVLNQIELQATLSGYQTQTKTVTISAGQEIRAVDFLLTPN